MFLFIEAVPREREIEKGRERGERESEKYKETKGGLCVSLYRTCAEREGERDVKDKEMKGDFVCFCL